jgi:hypothetical protein
MLYIAVRAYACLVVGVEQARMIWKRQASSSPLCHHFASGSLPTCSNAEPVDYLLVAVGIIGGIGSGIMFPVRQRAGCVGASSRKELGWLLCPWTR